MAPVLEVISPGKLIEDLLNQNKIVIFSKTTCPFCKKVKHLFNSLEVQYKVLELDKLANGAEIQEALFEITGHRTVPNVFINGKHLGGAETTVRTHEQGRLLSMIMPPTQQYDYDLCVIGGGSGGLAAAKQAAKLGKKVVLLDFVKPSPKGTTWGLGGTCVNVGCIPKKLMHQASLLGESLVDAKHFGWQVNKSEVAHNWQEMTEAVQNHIGSVNWNYRVQLRTKEVTYVNGYGEFVDDHTVKAIGRRNKETIITAERFVLAMGMRPRYDNIPGVKECSITSDDLFSLPYSPGKTLCVGASYVSLECAGFLAGLGMDVTVMVRSILLRGFDQQMAEKVGAYMENHGVKFIRGAVPTKLEQIEEGQPGVIRVHAKTTDGEDIVGDYNTVLYAIGRDACTTELGLEKLNVQLNPKNKKIVCNDADQSSVSHIYAIGDILDGRPELTPVAVQAGKLLAKRLFGGSTVLTDYVNVATTVFTPLEYGACGYSEEDAIDKFGAESIEVYHVNFWPLEFTVAQKSEKDCYAKLICNKLDSLRVVGLHILGPNAGEITQGYSVAIKMGATKDDFDTTIGIHPTVAEVFTTMEITKGSGEPFATAGC